MSILMQTGEPINTVEIWKFKHMMSKLGEAKGNGTSMISLLLTANETPQKAIKELSERLSNAQRIKSCV